MLLKEDDLAPFRSLRNDELQSAIAGMVKKHGVVAGMQRHCRRALAAQVAVVDRGGR